MRDIIDPVQRSLNELNHKIRKWKRNGTDPRRKPRLQRAADRLERAMAEVVAADPPITQYVEAIKDIQKTTRRHALHLQWGPNALVLLL